MSEKIEWIQIAVDAMIGDRLDGYHEDFIADVKIKAMQQYRKALIDADDAIDELVLSEKASYELRHWQNER